jgi:hypothetical protein
MILILTSILNRRHGPGQPRLVDPILALHELIARIFTGSFEGSRTHLVAFFVLHCAGRACAAFAPMILLLHHLVRMIRSRSAVHNGTGRGPRRWVAFIWAG